MSLDIRFRHRGRKVRKDMDQFLKDHAFNGHWFRPHKLRKVRPHTETEIVLLWEARELAQQAGRKRMVARGLWQYARAGDLTLEQAKEWQASGRRLDRSVEEEHLLGDPFGEHP